MNDQNGQPRVVIVGGGFAGLFAARMLARAAPPPLPPRSGQPIRATQERGNRVTAGSLTEA